MKFKPIPTFSSPVLIIGLISLIWIILYKTVFLEIESVFPKAFELGEIFYGLTGSIVASSIFYYIVVYRPAKQHLDKIKKTIISRIGRFELDQKIIMSDIYTYKKMEVPKSLPENWEDFREVCNGILLTDHAPIISNNPPFQPENWFEYFDYFFQLESVNKMMLLYYWDTIPIEVKILIEEIQTNTFHSGLNSYKELCYSNKLYDIAGPLWNHLSLLSKLPETLENNLKI